MTRLWGLFERIDGTLVEGEGAIKAGGGVLDEVTWSDGTVVLSCRRPRPSWRRFHQTLRRSLRMWPWSSNRLQET